MATAWTLWTLSGVRRRRERDLVPVRCRSGLCSRAWGTEKRPPGSPAPHNTLASNNLTGVDLVSAEVHPRSTGTGDGAALIQRDRQRVAGRPADIAARPAAGSPGRRRRRISAKWNRPAKARSGEREAFEQGLAPRVTGRPEGPPWFPATVAAVQGVLSRLF
jgi:hypothetical protein